MPFDHMCRLEKPSPQLKYKRILSPQRSPSCYPFILTITRLPLPTISNLQQSLMFSISMVSDKEIFEFFSWEQWPSNPVMKQFVNKTLESEGVQRGILPLISDCEGGEQSVCFQDVVTMQLDNRNTGKDYRGVRMYCVGSFILTCELFIII